MKNLTFLSNLSKNGTSLSGNRHGNVSIMWRKLATLLLILTLGIGNIWGAEVVYKTALFGSSYNSASVGDYTSSWSATNSGFTVDIVNGNNNQNGWSYIKFGRKNNASVGTITTAAAIDQAITKVAITIDALTAAKINSITLYKSPNGSSWTSVGTFTKATGAQTVTLSSPTANLYYKIEFDCASGTSNGLITISQVDYYYNNSGGGGGAVTAPTFDTAEGTICGESATIKVSNYSGSYNYYYTLDGATPTNSSTAYNHSTGVSITGTKTLKMIAYDGANSSTVTSATYTVTDISNTADDPYSVAEARALIDAGVCLEQPVYVEGYVSAITTAYNSTYHNISFDISADGTTSGNQFRFYRTGYDENGDAFTEDPGVEVGNHVIGYGYLTQYGATYELDADNWLIVNEGAEIDVTLSKNGITTTLSSQPSPYILPTSGPHVANACAEWDFYCWASAPYAKSTTEPTCITRVTTTGTVYAIYRHIEGGGGGGAATNTILYAEPFTGFSNDATPSSPGGSATVYSGASITYTHNNGTTTTSKVTTANGGNLAGGDSPEYMIGKSNGSFTISGIPSGGAETLSVSYKTNAKSCTASVSGTGYSGGLTTSTTGTHSFDVTVGSSATFSLTFAAGTSDNVRLDDIEVKVKTAGVGGGTTYYATSAECCTEVETPEVTVVARETSVTLSWNAQADAVNGYHVTCSDGTDEDLTTTSITIEGLTRGTTYTYEVIAKGATCNRSTIDEFTTNESTITIAEWATDAVYLDLGNATTATAVIEHQDTQQEVATKYAEGLFFSKYFEAGGNNKMLAIYNGTQYPISLTGYFIQNGARNENSYRLSLSGFGKTPGTIAPNEEIVIARFDNDDDKTAKDCAEKEDSYSNWVAYTQGESAPTGFHNTMEFGGRMSLALYYASGGDTTMIDIIGSHYGTTYGYTGTRLTKISKDSPCTKGNGLDGGYLVIDGQTWSDAPGYFCLNGDNVRTAAEETNYPLSTNRCLLVRKNTVVSGAHAVATNVVNPSLIGPSDCRAMAESFQTLSEEWAGFRIGSGASTDKELNDSTCTGLAYLGGFDYNDYYVDYVTIATEDISSNRQSDGTYKITIDDLDEMSCTNLRITVTKDGTETVSGTWQVPIFVEGSINTNNTVFTKEGDDCATCDVVVLRNATLGVVTPGKNTVRNIEIYPNATLSVPSGQTYNITRLIFRSKEDAIARADIRGNLDQKEATFALDKRILATRWYKIALPYRCRIADVTFRSGELAHYGTDWILQYYDGDRRASGNDDGGNWITYTGEYIEPGVGYNLGINSDILESGNIYGELRFPMAANTHFAEATYIDVPVKAYGKGRTVGGKAVTPNHLGWNIIGAPYMMDYTTGSVATPLTVGRLDPDGITYKLTDTGLRYVVELNHSTGLYSQTAIGSGKKEMEPFMAYFVQVTGASDNESLNVRFNKNQQHGRSVIRRASAEYEDDNHIVWAPFELTNSLGESDETTLLISDKFTNDYDMMDDLVKMRGTYSNYTMPVLATRNNDGEMAFNALPDNTASVTGVPVNYFAKNAGNYTFSLNSRYGIDEIKEAQLYDANTQNYYNLLTDNYTFATEAGENTTRFRLYVTVERNKVPTDNDLPTLADVALTTIGNTLVLSGLNEASDIYVYDMSGKLMQNAHANGNGEIWRTHVPATSVYFVRVNTANGQQTLRAVVK